MVMRRVSAHPRLPGTHPEAPTPILGTGGAGRAGCGGEHCKVAFWEVGSFGAPAPRFVPRQTGPLLASQWLRAQWVSTWLSSLLPRAVLSPHHPPPRNDYGSASSTIKRGGLSEGPPFGSKFLLLLTFPPDSVLTTALRADQARPDERPSSPWARFIVESPI